jgi:hypothetical protein
MKERLVHGGAADLPIRHHREEQRARHGEAVTAVLKITVRHADDR